MKDASEKPAKAPTKPANPKPVKKPSKPAEQAHDNPFNIPAVRGLQKISRLYGYRGQIDNIWGAGSQAGWAEFLRRNWGYAGNDVYGPVMWKATQRWLRDKWGYKGAIDGIRGPLTRDALKRAEAGNWKSL